MSTKMTDSGILISDGIKTAGIEFDGANFKASDGAGGLVGMQVAPPEVDSEATSLSCFRGLSRYHLYTSTVSWIVSAEPTMSTAGILLIASEQKEITDDMLRSQSNGKTLSDVIPLFVEEIMELPNDTYDLYGIGGRTDSTRKAPILPYIGFSISADNYLSSTIYNEGDRYFIKLMSPWNINTNAIGGEQFSIRLSSLGTTYTAARSDYEGTGFFDSYLWCFNIK